MHHYSEIELERYRSGKMNVLLRTLCRFHLWNCPECHAVFEKMEEDELLIADLKLSLSKDPAPENPETYQKLCDHFQSVKGSSL